MRRRLAAVSLSIGRRWAGGPLNRHELRRAMTGASVWLVALLAIWAIYFSPKHLVSASTMISYLLALGVLLLAIQRPDRSLLILIALFPFQSLLLAKLYSFGVPASAVKALGAWKETLALAVVLAGARNFIASGRRLDTLDRLALGFVAITAIYALLQSTIVPGAPSTSSIRLLGFRETAGFVLLLFAARHAPLGPRFAERVARVLFASATIVAAVGIFEAIDSSAWNHFVVNTIQYPRYSANVLGSQLGNPNDIRIYGTVGGSQFVRIGSVFLDELSLSWFLILPFAIGIERVVRGRASAMSAMCTLAIGAALLLTQTRSAILAGAVVVLLTLPYAAGRGRHWRVRASLIIAAIAMMAVPAAFATNVAKRIETTTNKSDLSTAGHIGGFWGGLRTIEKHPLGQGLGTAAGTGQRYQVANDLIAENNYLEVGDELGVGPMLLFVVLTIALLVWLRRAMRARVDPMATAAWTAGLGLAVAAWFLQTWESFPVAWTYWAIAGSTLIATRQRSPAPDALPLEHGQAYPAIGPAVGASASR